MGRETLRTQRPAERIVTWGFRQYVLSGSCFAPGRARMLTGFMHSGRRPKCAAIFGMTLSSGARLQRRLSILT
jgi:hypothetical protein